MGTYSVDRMSTGTGGSTYRAFRVSNTAGTFAIPPATNTLNGICNWPTGDDQSVEHTSSFVDVRRVHSIYVHSDFGNHNCVSPTGVRSVLAKVPVQVGYGGLVHAQMSGSEHDFVEAGSHSLSTIKLTLHDAAGGELDLKGTSWSCTLVFERESTMLTSAAALARDRPTKRCLRVKNLWLVSCSRSCAVNSVPCTEAYV